MKLVSHIQNRVFAFINVESLKDNKLKLLNYDDMFNKICQISNSENNILSYFKKERNEREYNM